VLYVAYSAGRLVADDDRRTAVANGRRLLHVEGLLDLDVERRVNHALDRLPDLALVASYWYAALHYLVTPAVLVWVYRRHARHYRRARNALVAATSVGLLGFVLLPMAPPRMLPGFVDTLAATSAHGWWGGDASAPKGLGGLTNEFAAMPSLHVGWAIWCAWVVFRCTRSIPARALATAYAMGTAVVVVATGNHYVLDAVAGAAVVGLGIAASSIRVTGLAHRARRYLPPRASAADRCPGLGQGDPGGAAGAAVRDQAHLERRPAA
jgi:hypothetical protein